MRERHRKNTEIKRGSADFVRRFRLRWRLIASTVIVLWAIWTLLDAFVIPKDIVEAGAAAGNTIEETAAADTGGRAASADASDPASDPHKVPEEENDEEVTAYTEPVITENSYEDGMTSIQIHTMRTHDTTVYIADIELSDPSCLRTALAYNSFGRNLTDTTSSMAQQHDAILAINGDYYGFRERGYVMRSGFLYRSEAANDPEQEDLVLYPDGSMAIVRESEISAKQLAQGGASEIFSFGPGLITDGQIKVSSDDEVERAQVTNPRTAIGLLSPLHYIFLVSDGRTKESKGLSLLELAELMQDLGCVTAYNLDGGGSSTFWFNGRVLNRPTTYGKQIEERSISDIVYIGQPQR